MKNLKDLNDWSDILEHQKLGELLMQGGKLNLIHLGMALDIQRFEDMQIGEVLINMKVITEDDLKDALYIQSYIDKLINESGE